jgi:hypothetical protein
VVLPLVGRVKCEKADALMCAFCCPCAYVGSIATMNTTELELYNASKAGDVSKVKAVLTATPTVDVNKRNLRDVRDGCVMQTAAVRTHCVAVGQRHGTDCGCQTRP